MARIKVANRRGPEGLPAVAETGPALSLLNALLASGIHIRHDCGGKALCGTCALRAMGDGAGLSPIGEREGIRLSVGDRPPGTRLACQAHASQDLVVELLLD